MAMLAEPRRKQKVINLRAKNNAWSNDSNKFGQRMLEKMGWSEGKGLGANENGIVEHVVARYKNDDKGLGYEDRNDQWTKHEDDFNSLLANLSNGDKNDDKLHSGVSLEAKSKKSKVRVHYHKFTRGKDLTRYSEKDLANIFGKKSLKNKDKQEEPKSEPEDIVQPTEQVFTEKGSMVDYFKNKLASLKSKNKINVLDNAASDDRADCGFRGFAGAGSDEAGNDENNQGLGFQVQSFCQPEKLDVLEDNGVSEIESTKKSKKKKKNKKREDQPLENSENLIIENVNTPENICEEVVPKKNKKSKKEKEIVAIEEAVEVKKSKKNKRNAEITEDHAVEDYVPKKKKKRKNKDISN